MMFPSVFGENLFDDWMDDFGFRDNFFGGKNPLYGKHAKNIMKTDVRETDKGYELDVVNTPSLSISSGCVSDRKRKRRVSSRAYSLL